MGARPYRTLRSWPYKPGQSQGLPLHGMGVYDPEIHRRRSMRLKGYDYTQAGAYLVTIVVQGRFPPFGAVADGRMRLNGAGEMVRRIWTEMPNRFPSIKMDAFITMPNHIHGIIILVGAPLVGAQPVTDVTGRRIPARATTRVAPTEDGRIRLGDVVGAYKSLTTLEYTRGVHAMNWPPFHERLWQRNYHETIVRDDPSMQKSRQYILDNPLQWPFDRENPIADRPVRTSP